MTKGDAIALMLRWLDEATVNGQEATPEQLADYKDRAAYMLDGVMKFLAGHFKIPAVFSVVREPIRNLTGRGFEIVPIYPDKPYELIVDGAKSFYLEGEGDITVALGSGENTVTKSYNTDTYTPVRGNIDTLGGQVKLTVSSMYPASVRNVAMYEYAFPDDDSVPEYIPYVPYTLPQDFREFDKCVQTSDHHTYREFPDVRREGHNTYLLPYGARGQFDFHYLRNPADIAPDAPDDTLLEIEPRAAQLVPLKLAVDVTVGVDDTATISHYLSDRFNFLMANILTEDRGGTGAIDPIYSM